MQKENCNCLGSCCKVKERNKNGDPLTGLLFIAFVAFLLTIGFLLGVVLI